MIAMLSEGGKNKKQKCAINSSKYINIKTIYNTTVFSKIIICYIYIKFLLCYFVCLFFAGVSC